LEAARRAHLERVGLILGLALNGLTHLAEATRDAWAALRARRSSRWDGLRALPRLAEVLLAHTARIAEEAAAAAALRGHTALSRHDSPITVPVRVVVATGATGSGKTTAVEAVVEAIKRTREPVAGFLQPGTWKDGVKVGFRVRDVRSGEEAPLATEVGVGQGDAGTRFRFDDAGFALARRALQRVSPGDLLVIDELGPVELRGQGHMESVRRALSVEGLAGVVVSVRRNLVPPLLAALETEDAEVVDLAHHGPQAPQAVLRALGLEAPTATARPPSDGREDEDEASK
jgi:nucleoside-triphosphatase THEP1